MATKGGREKIKLESTAGTGHFYTTSKNKKTMPEKLSQEIRSEGSQACAVQGNQAEVNARARQLAPAELRTQQARASAGLFDIVVRPNRLRALLHACAVGSGVRGAQLQRELLQRRDAAAPRRAGTRPAGRPPAARPTRWCGSRAGAVPRASSPAWPAPGCAPRACASCGCTPLRDLVVVAVQPALGQAHVRPARAVRRALRLQAGRFRRARRCAGRRRNRPSPRSGWR